MVGLTNCWRLSMDQCESKKFLRATFWGTPHSHRLYLQETDQVLIVKIQDRYTRGSGKGKGRVITMKHAFSIMKACYPEEKTFPELYHNQRKGISPTPATYIALLSHLRQIFYKSYTTGEKQQSQPRDIGLLNDGDLIILIQNPNVLQQVNGQINCGMPMQRNTTQQ